MPMLTLGLTAAGLAFLYVSWASWSAGYPPEVALLRGLVGFMAAALVGYAGEFIVATAPPRAAEQPAAAEQPQPAALPAVAARQPEAPTPPGDTDDATPDELPRAA